MKIAVAGLGRMGLQIVKKLVEDGHEVLAYDVSPEQMKIAAAAGAQTVAGKEAVVAGFKGEKPVVWLMIPSEHTDDELANWQGLLPGGSIVVDGGNSDYRKTRQRSAQYEASGLSLVDVGTSGGVWGYKNGFSLMVGGNDNSFKTIEPVLVTLSKPNGAYHHFGPGGAGHYTKMVHNAIEYGMMQSLAEGYHLLKAGPYKDIDLAKAGEVWQHGSVVTSWLNELTHQALTENPNLDGIDGYVAESGEARWALETAREIGLPTPAIQASFEVRLSSQQGQTNFATKLLAAMRAKFGGHSINKQ